MKTESYVPVPVKEDHTQVIVLASKLHHEPRRSTLKRIVVCSLLCLGLLALFADEMMDCKNHKTKTLQHFSDHQEEHGFFRGHNNLKKSIIPPTLLPGIGRDWTINVEEQTISSKRDDNLVLGAHPHKPLVLTAKGAANQLTFPSDLLQQLQDGKKVSLPGLGLQYPDEDMKEYDGWAYTEAAASSSVDEESGSDLDSMTTSLEFVDENFLTTKDKDGFDIVLNVSFWQYSIGNTVNFLSSSRNEDNNDSKWKKWWNKNFKKTYLYGGGRDWTLNVEDGTISPTHAPYLVLGYGPSRLILTTKDSSSVHKFDNLDQLANGETVKLTFADSSTCLGEMYEEEKYFGPWRYIESEIMDSEDDCISVRYVEDNYIATVKEGVDEEKALVLDISFDAIRSGNTVNFVGGFKYE